MPINNSVRFTGFSEEPKHNNLYFCVDAELNGAKIRINPPSYSKQNFDSDVLTGKTFGLNDFIPFPMIDKMPSRPSVILDEENLINKNKLHLVPSSLQRGPDPIILSEKDQTKGIRQITGRFTWLRWFLQKFFCKVVPSIEKLTVTYLFQNKIEKVKTFYVARESSKDYWSRFEKSGWKSKEMWITNQESNDSRNVQLNRKTNIFFGTLFPA